MAFFEHHRRRPYFDVGLHDFAGLQKQSARVSCDTAGTAGLSQDRACDARRAASLSPPAPACPAGPSPSRHCLADRYCEASGTCPCPPSRSTPERRRQRTGDFQIRLKRRGIERQPHPGLFPLPITCDDDAEVDPIVPRLGRHSCENSRRTAPRCSRRRSFRGQIEIDLRPLRARERPFAFLTCMRSGLPPVRISSLTAGSFMMPVSMPFSQ